MAAAVLGTAIARWQGGVGRYNDATENPKNITDHAACSAETTPGQFICINTLNDPNNGPPSHTTIDVTVSADGSAWQVAKS